MGRVGVRWRAALLAVVTVATGLASSTPAASADVAPQAVTVGVGTSVVSGQYHTCVINQATTVSCWGFNHESQLGAASSNLFENTPVVTFNQATSSVASSFRHTCALATSSTVWCWGKNDFGQTAQPTTSPNTLTPTQVPISGNVTSISAGELFTCASRADGTVACWGRNDFGQLGNASPTPSPTAVSPTPVEVTGLSGVIAVDAGDNFACALKTDGSVWCWGDNSVGQLGRGSRGGFTSVAAPIEGLDRVTGLASGFAHACARKTSGSLFCWGSGDKGQLGSGDLGNRPTPEIVPGLGSVSSVAAAQYTTCAVTSAGAARCWGNNDHGQLGNGNTVLSSSPVNVQLPAGTKAAVIAPGYNHTCALLTNQRVACWGANPRGELGNGQPIDSPDSLVPVFVSNLSGVPITTAAPSVGGPTPAPQVTDQPYSPLAAPERVLDTRPGANDVVDGNGSYQGIGPISSKSLQIAGRGTVPTGVASAFLNVTVVGAGAEGYLSVYPCDAGVPNASNLNFKAGDTVANAVMSKLDGSGQVCIFASAAVNVLVDVAGYFPSTASFTPLAAPRRLLETRFGATPTIDNQAYGEGRRTDPQTTTLTVAGRNAGEIPSGVASVALNVTAVDGDAAGGYLTVWPCDAGQPNTSNVNYSSGQTIPNLVIAKVAANGTICLFNYKRVDLLVDIVGYFSTTISYTPLAAPARFMDTRAGGITVDTVAAGPTPNTLDGVGEYKLTVGGRSGISPSAGAVLANVTVANSLGDGYLSVYPCGQARPEVSNINYKSGQTIANSVAAGIGSNKQICIYSSTPTEVLVDVAGTLS